MPDKLQAYISFAQEDRRQVRELESRLRAEGFGTWFDEKDLTPGMDWEDVINQALPRSDAFVSCFSTRSVSRDGFYNKELALALRDKRPGFVIPVRLDECGIPAPYLNAQLQWIDLFVAGGFERLIGQLRARLTEFPDRARDFASTVPAAAPAPEVIRILHLSDLHFKKDDDHEQLLDILDEDLTSNIDYLVVSGDLSDRCNKTGYKNAEHFLSEVRTRKSIPQKHCILVPGNHDVHQDLGNFEIRQKIEKGDDAVKALAGNLETTIYLVRKAGSYADRFARFADVHKTFTGRDYDLTDPNKQVCVVRSDEHRLQFLGLNSAWEIDQFRPKRASIRPRALDAGIKSLRLKPEYLNIAVWHHAITGNDKIKNDVFLERLSKQGGVRLCLHGDVHELRPDIVGPHSSSRIHVVGIGAFGAGPDDRPESTPRMYNLIEISNNRTRASVTTRQQPKPGNSFRAYGAWSFPGQRDVSTGRYEFTLDPPAPSEA
jgi:hypothetical protein